MELCVHMYSSKSIRSLARCYDYYMLYEVYFSVKLTNFKWQLWHVELSCLYDNKTNGGGCWTWWAQFPKIHYSNTYTIFFVIMVFMHTICNKKWWKSSCAQDIDFVLSAHGTWKQHTNMAKCLRNVWIGQNIYGADQWKLIPRLMIVLCSKWKK